METESCRFRHTDKVSRGWLGVLRNQPPGGVRITQVIPDSPADLFGIQPADEIISFNGKQIKTFRQLQGLVASLKPSTRVTLTISRNTEILEIDLALGELNMER